VAIKLPCPNCDGKGTVPLPEHLKDVLDLVKRGFNVAEDIRPHLSDKITVNAVSGRLSELRGFGLIECKRDGRYLRYTVSK
jgi:DNA-binding transcriptional ArsR family regulator